MRKLLATVLALTFAGHAAALAQATAPPKTQPAAQAQPAPAQTPKAPAPTQKPAAPPAAKPGAAAPQNVGPSVAVEPGFTIGPEDVLGVIVWREADVTGEVTVRPDGMITLPLIRDVRAAGLTPQELADRVQTLLREYITDASVTVVVRQMNSRKVFITGEVGKPGAYPLTSSMTVMQLIAVAGGLTEYAEGKSISVMRVEGGQTKTFPFDYRNVASGKKPGQNILLRPGDTVVVPER